MTDSRQLDIRVRGARNAYEIAAVVALLGREPGPAPAPAGVTAWQRTRRAALRAGRTVAHREPRP